MAPRLAPHMLQRAPPVLLKVHVPQENAMAPLSDLRHGRTLAVERKSGIIRGWAQRVQSGWGGSRAPGGHAAGAWGSGATSASSLGGFGHLHGRGGQRQRGRASRETVLEGWAADGGASHAMPPPYAPPHAS